MPARTGEVSGVSGSPERMADVVMAVPRSHGMDDAVLGISQLVVAERRHRGERSERGQQRKGQWKGVS